MRAPFAVDIRAQLDSGRATAEAIASDCLRRIAQRDDEVGAWTYVSREVVMDQARSRDNATAGALRGVPIGVKDLIDTADMPTEYGSPLYAGHRPSVDATCVARIRDAGGVVVGKTTLTEFAASFRDVRTRNPLDLTRTPGGSSNGSAAAVADGMVPLALGSQTGGSVLRPASYCGIVGYKPTFGAISRAGVRPISPSIDSIGVFGRSVADIRLLARVLVGPDPRDPPTLQRLIDLELRGDASPQIAYTRTPWHRYAEPFVLRLLDQLAADLRDAGASVTAIELTEPFDEAVEAARTIMEYEGARQFAPDYDRGRDRMATDLVSFIESGQRTSAAECERARSVAEGCCAAIAAILAEYDVLLTPVVTGEAPPHGNTGDPVFCRVWSMLGNPTIAVPAALGPSGLPVGFQLIAAHGKDGELLRIAEWVARAANARFRPAAVH